MSTQRTLNIFALALVVLAAFAIVVRNLQAKSSQALLNVSYDPTRELYAQLNPQFLAQYERSTGQKLSIKQAHGGSSRQARAVIAGDLEADVVTLGLSSDVEALRKRGLIAADWANRLPNHAQPYYSTIVFVVRRGNPFQIHDWPDLLQPGVAIITPDPRSSGNGKLSALAAWGDVIARGGSETDAKAYLKQFYEHAPFLESGARSTALAFAIEKQGDVHVTWENEALREVSEGNGELELVYPPRTILAEPCVAWVDANVSKHHSQAFARAYLEYLFTDQAQELIAQAGYRPYNQQVLARHEKRLPHLTLLHITDIAKDWEDAQQRFFGENGVIDTVYTPKPR
jgi:sulfate transport system substrate-binding protein